MSVELRKSLTQTFDPLSLKCLFSPRVLSAVTLIFAFFWQEFQNDNTFLNDSTPIYTNPLDRLLSLLVNSELYFTRVILPLCRTMQPYQTRHVSQWSNLDLTFLWDANSSLYYLEKLNSFFPPFLPCNRLQSLSSFLTSPCATLLNRLTLLASFHAPTCLFRLLSTRLPFFGILYLDWSIFSF